MEPVAHWRLDGDVVTGLTSRAFGHCSHFSKVANFQHDARGQSDCANMQKCPSFRVVCKGLTATVRVLGLFDSTGGHSRFCWH